MRYQELVARIAHIYDNDEARSIVKMLLEDAFGLSFVDVCLGALDNMTEEDCSQLESMMQRLENNEPIQYVIGTAMFYGRAFGVEHGVLIPRPETEELIDWIKQEADGVKGDRNGKKNILDIGCGSGCISVSLAAELVHAEVAAWDVSDTALRVTRDNAKKHGVNVDIYMQDALSAPSDDTELWDIIVSNPPYICNKEAEAMEKHVLDHEPHVALFVPDSDPLLFYRAISLYALHALRRGGKLFFEINEAYGQEMVNMLHSFGYEQVELKQDQFGKNRMIKACVRTQKTF